MTLVSTLRSFFELGGFCVHYNVLNTEILKKAMEDPDRYPNLQVRLCGWNVLFSSLSDKEKAEFIERSIKEA
jgi:formate C-acetyltransferase